MKIKQLQLHNFKFFTDEDNTLNFNSKNVLIWGENGSGKSSIYWAIYTLLQCSYKEKQDIDNYFTVTHKKNLLNIHKAVEADAFIEMQLDNGNNYKIALGEDSIVGNQDIQLSAISSDFIDYNVVASFLRFMHQHEPDQLALFEEQIFRFMPFNAPAPFTFKYFDKAIEKLREGLEKNKTSKKFPSTGSTIYDQYKSLTDEFNRQLRQELGLITTKANTLLKDKFGYDIEIELAYSPFDFVLNRPSTQIKYTEPSIILKVNKYFDKTNVVHRPHSFLNEAKKSSIGLAIRLAILERRLLVEEKLNVLALDDLLISLDMSNREVVLKLLFEEYQEKYQLLIFTHDKQFFNIAKNKIENNTYKENWLFWEFYVNEKNPNKPVPHLFENQSELSKALNHLSENDYPAAANYLRKHCEKILENNIPTELYANLDKEEPNSNYNLNSMLNRTSIFYTSIKQTNVVISITALMQYVQILLNPLSHTDRGVQRHKNEIKNVINCLDTLEKSLINAEFGLHLKAGDFVTLTLVKSAILRYEISVRLKDIVYWYKNGVDKSFTIPNADSISIKEYENNVLKETKPFTYYPNQSLPTLYKAVTNHKDFAIPEIPNWETLFTKTDGTILNTLMII